MVSKYLKNIFETGELDRKTTVAIWETVPKEQAQEIVVRWLIPLQKFIFQSVVFWAMFLGAVQIGFSQKWALPPLNDSIMRREMAFFTIADTFTGGSDVKLKEVPLWFSDESQASLNTTGFFDDGRHLYFEFAAFHPEGHQITYSGGQDSMISAIDGKPCWGIDKRLPKRYLKNIRLIIHSHLEVAIPENALEGIFEPPVYHCQTKKDRRRPQHFFKFYVSQNGFKYIYMLGGQGKNRYETVWVIYGSTYHARFVQLAPESISHN